MLQFHKTHPLFHTLNFLFEKFLLKELKSLLSKYDELYLDPIIRDNGDFLIPLHPDLKKNKEAQKRVADAFSEMMKADLSKKPKSKAWV